MSTPALTRRVRARAIAVALAVVVLGLWPGLASAAPPQPSVSATCAVYPGNTTATWSHAPVLGIDLAWYDVNGLPDGGFTSTFGHAKMSGHVSEPTRAGAVSVIVTFVGFAKLPLLACQ